MFKFIRSLWFIYSSKNIVDEAYIRSGARPSDSFKQAYKDYKSGKRPKV